MPHVILITEVRTLQLIKNQMKYTRVFRGNQYVTKFQVDGKRLSLMKRISNRIKITLWRAAKVCVIAWMVVGGLLVGQHLTPANVVYADKEVIKEVEVNAPVLERIATCESGGKHLGKSGQVIIKTNTNGTVDIGKYQINSVWFKKATEMGLDLTKEKDNEAMAKYIYANRGTGDWSASSACWNK